MNDQRRETGPAERKREDDPTARAEERARELSEQATRGALRLLARAREELEDMWAEARDRRGSR